VRKLSLPAVFIRLGCFNDNMIKFEFVTKNEDGTLTINIPHAQYNVKNSQSEPGRARGGSFRNLTLLTLGFQPTA
jgi:hypothetical protein